MESIFDKIWRLGPAGLVLKAIIVAVIADALLLAFILLRRTYRKRYFARRDARVFELRQKWNALTLGQISFLSWRNKSFDRRIVETMALDAFEAAAPQEAARLLQFPRESAGRNIRASRSFARQRSRNQARRSPWLRTYGKPASRRGNPNLARRKR